MCFEFIYIASYVVLMCYDDVLGWVGYGGWEDLQFVFADTRYTTSRQNLVVLVHAERLASHFING